MIHSMTGFGSCELLKDSYKISCQIQSLNSKYLDINLKINRKYSYLENFITELVQKHLSRGKILVDISIEEEDENSLSINSDKATSFHDFLYTLEADYNIKPSISFDDLVRLELLKNPNQANKEDDDLVKGLLEKVIKNSINELLLWREEEGKKLNAQIQERLDELRASTEQIKALSPRLTEQYKKQLEARLEEIKDLDIDYLDLRLEEELMVYIEKSDIDEELTRLFSHIELFEKSIKQDGPVGKKLDFICQEFLRETNTIGSKSKSTEISHIVIDMKTLIDQIREQVQNIE